MTSQNEKGCTSSEKKIFSQHFFKEKMGFNLSVNNVFL